MKTLIAYFSAETGRTRKAAEAIAKLTGGELFEIKPVEEYTKADFMKVFEEFGAMKAKDPKSAEVQGQVKKLQTFISDHFYKCSDEVLFGLGQMYAAGGEFTENIDKMGGEGTAEFTARAISIYCGK